MDTVYDYLEKLDWSQEELANRAGVTKSQVSGWLAKGDRAIAQDDVCRIVWAIAGGLDGVFKGMPRFDRHEEDSIDRERQTGRLLKGRAFLDQVLNECLQKAGFAPATSPIDLIWRLIFSPDEDSYEGEPPSNRENERKKKLKVGWVLWPAFAEPDHQGFARKITEQICHYLGAGEPDWEDLNPEDVAGAIQKRKVDFIAPVLIQLPRRLVYLRFSKPIPRVTVGIKAVMSTKAPRNEGLRFRPCVIGGEVGETMADVLFPKEGHRPTRFKTLDDAVIKLDAQPVDPITEHVRCLVVDEITYYGMMRNYKGKFEDVDIPVAENEHIWKARFPIGLAVHPNEPCLLLAINSCIDILADNGYFDSLIEEMKDSDKSLATMIIDNKRTKRSSPNSKS